MQIDPTHDRQASTFPLIVGVTGHRDIAPEARQAVAAAVGTLLCHLKHRTGQDALYVPSALAQAARRTGMGAIRPAWTGSMGSMGGSLVPGPDYNPREI